MSWLEAHLRQMHTCPGPHTTEHHDHHHISPAAGQPPHTHATQADVDEREHKMALIAQANAEALRIARESTGAHEDGHPSQYRALLDIERVLGGVPDV